MTSAIEAQAFQFSDIRPETSKCSRGASNKFNKTQAGFYNEKSSSQNQYSENNSQKAVMNITGFNFRQNKHQEQKIGFINSQQKTPKPSINNQQFSSTSQGFYQNKRQNSFSKGITLEQYFQNVHEQELQQQQEDNQNEGMLRNSNNNNENTPSRNKNPQSFLLSDLKIIDEDFQDGNKKQMRQKQEKPDNEQKLNKRNSNSKDEQNNQQYSEGQYDSDEFEIHEESGEEEEDEDEENKKKKKKKQINSSTKKQGIKTIECKSIKGATSSPQMSSGKKQSELNEYSYGEFEDPPIEDLREEKIQQQENKKDIKQKIIQESQKLEEQTKQLKENDVNSSNKFSQQFGDSENVKIPISNEDQIQKKIRDKYFKKTIHKPFITQQVTQTAQVNKKTTYNSQNPHNIPNSSITSNTGTINTNQNIQNNFSGYISNSNQNQAAAGVTKVNSPNLQGYSQSNMTNSSFLNQSNHVNSQQTNQHFIANISSYHSKVPIYSQASSTGHNFYSQNHQNINTGNAAPTNNTNTPNAYIYAAANITNKKPNKSQSPLHAFKRSSNLGHSQQRRPSKELAESNFPEDNQIMRTTFNNTTQKFKKSQTNHNQILNNYDTNNGSTQSFENHIAFRNSFYKGPPLIGGNNGVTNNTNNNNSKQRLTINDFYKNQSKFECYDQPSRAGGFHIQNNADYLTDVMMMRRTAKEHKFLNQKDKIQEMAKEDVNYITKHAARFNINPSELVQIKQKN